MQSVTPVCININPSRWLLAWVLLLHSLFLYTCLLYLPHKLALLGICLLSCSWTLWKSGWFSHSKFIDAVQIDAKGNMSIKTKQQSDWRAVTMENSSVFTRFACVLHLKENTHIHKMCLFPDSTSEAHYRTLCVYGRWQKITSPSINPHQIKG